MCMYNIYIYIYSLSLSVAGLGIPCPNAECPFFVLGFRPRAYAQTRSTSRVDPENPEPDEPQPKLLKGGCIGHYTGKFYRAY